MMNLSSFWAIFPYGYYGCLAHRRYRFLATMLSVLVLSALAASPGHGSAVTGPAGCGRHCSGHCTPGLGAVGPALSSANDVPSACACLRLCANDPVAQAWQWVSKKGEHNYRTCYLKGTVDLQPNPVYVSGCMPKGRANATARCPARPPAPPVPPVPPVPPGRAGATFPNSRLITPAQGLLLNSWANQTVVGQKWALCYTSFTMDKTSPAQFHKNCDQYAPTVTVAHNTGGPGGRGVCKFNKDGCKTRECDCGACKPPLMCIHTQGTCVPCTFPGCGTCFIDGVDTGDDCGPIGSICGFENTGNFTFGGYVRCPPPRLSSAQCSAPCIFGGYGYVCAPARLPHGAALRADSDLPPVPT